MQAFVITIVSITTIGIVCAVVLSVASRVFAVKIDERVKQMRELMPGANCGACGFSGCEGYASALAAGDVATNLCPPGGNELVKQLSSIMGTESGEGIANKIAVIHCVGVIDKRHDKMDYEGIRTCKAAKLLFGGQSACSFGCIGYGDCVAICPSNAICLEKCLARVNVRKCSGCELCVKACPYGLITIEDGPVAAAVMCNNTEKGAKLKDKCSAGCIGCKKCEKECPENAITVNDSLASIDYSKCNGCGKCIDICVKGCIATLSDSDPV